jgi:hypothetical protein
MISSNLNMPKEKMTPGTFFHIALSKIFVDRVGEQNLHYFFKEIERHLNTACVLRNGYPEEDISITVDGQPITSIIASSFEQKKTQEKSGQT